MQCVDFRSSPSRLTLKIESQKKIPFMIQDWGTILLIMIPDDPSERTVRGTDGCIRSRSMIALLLLWFFVIIRERKGHLN